MEAPKATAVTHRILGRVFLEGEIRVVTGLHIGGAPAGLAIGGVDNPVIRDPLTKRPYVPGSSIRGKMRSLSEKFYHLAMEQEISKQVKIHSCKTQPDYLRCDHCQVFGVPGSRPGEPDFGGPTRLIVRDARLDEGSAEALKAAPTDLPYTEVKWEAAIDRVTSAATPRQIERVPAGALFKPLELVYTVYDDGDPKRFLRVIEALGWVEDDYLGGLGARGSGKVRFENIHITCRNQKNYRQTQVYGDGKPATIGALLGTHAGLEQWLSTCLFGKG